MRTSTACVDSTCDRKAFWSLLNLGDLYAECGQTLQGSLTAVSKPNFASQYALESSRRDLHNALLCTALESTAFGIHWRKMGKKGPGQNNPLSNLKIFVKILPLYFYIPKICEIQRNSAKLHLNYYSSRLSENFCKFWQNSNNYIQLHF